MLCLFFGGGEYLEQRVFTVSEVNQYMKQLVDQQPALNDLLIRGEISNYKVYPSGHHYFTLKDGQSALRCVLFVGYAKYLRFRPENGMQVIAAGRISVYPRDGAYQLYCTRLVSDGMGDLHAAFEQLKEKLYQEGLFDQAHKKKIPRFPERIALITSSAGAAVRDMIRILGARWPMSQVLVLPVRVQGEEAPEEIAAVDLALIAPDSLQQETAEGLTLESTLCAEEPSVSLVERIALRDAIDALPEKERKTILLRFFKGLTQEQTARILQVSQVQVSRLERRSLQKLRDLLAEE